MYQSALSQFELCAVVRLLAIDIYCMYSILFFNCGNFVKGDTSNIDWDHVILRWILSSVYCRLPDWECCLDQILVFASSNGIQVSCGSYLL